MVRTSDFQFENEGSIPSNPINMLNNNLQKLLLFKIKKKNYATFNFFFISLISPHILTNVRFLFNVNNKEKKLLLKQSYILLTWFYYLNFLKQSTNTKNKIKIFVAPLFKKKFTLTKAPMAHKNWSKEQYKFQFFKFRISFNIFLKDENNLTSLNNALLFIFLIKKTFPQFETNLFFLKNVTFSLFTTDPIYFNYNKFLNK